MSANESPLKLMYLSPVGMPDYDGVFADMARAVKLPGTEVHVTSLKPAAGAFMHIEYRSYEAVVSTGIVRAARAAAAEGFDALAIGCFYDTALHEAREVFGDIVVTAPCAASLEIAASFANRFGVIVGRRKWVHQMHATVGDNGMAKQLSGFYPVELGVTDFQADHAVTERLLTEAGKKAVEEDYAEAIILGCILETGSMPFWWNPLSARRRDASPRGRWRESNLHVIPHSTSGGIRDRSPRFGVEHD